MTKPVSTLSLREIIHVKNLLTDFWTFWTTFWTWIGPPPPAHLDNVQNKADFYMDVFSYFTICLSPNCIKGKTNYAMLCTKLWSRSRS